jgi:hypothetical protein
MKKEVIKGPRVQGCRGGPMCPPKELSEDGPDVLYGDEAVLRPEKRNYRKSDHKVLWRY